MNKDIKTLIDYARKGYFFISENIIIIWNRIKLNSLEKRFIVPQ